MTRRTYQVALTATVSVDDEAVQGSLIGFTPGSNPDLPEPTAEETFDLQQQMLAGTSQMPPAQRLQILLVNQFFVPTREDLTTAIQSRIDGSQVELTGVTVDEV